MSCEGLDRVSQAANDAGVYFEDLNDPKGATVAAILGLMAEAVETLDDIREDQREVLVLLRRADRAR